MSKETSRALESWDPLSDRIIAARFNSRHIKTTIIQVYTPTNDADTEERTISMNGCNRCTTRHLGMTPKKRTMTIGDWNAKLGHQTEGARKWNDWQALLGGKRGRSRETWRRTVEWKRAEMKLTSWTTATALAKNREKWGQLISGPISHLVEGN